MEEFERQVYERACERRGLSRLLQGLQISSRFIPRAVPWAGVKRLYEAHQGARLTRTFASSPIVASQLKGFRSLSTNLGSSVAPVCKRGSETGGYNVETRLLLRPIRNPPNLFHFILRTEMH